MLRPRTLKIDYLKADLIKLLQQNQSVINFLELPKKGITERNQKRILKRAKTQIKHIENLLKTL
jgi:hypothetical protein